MAVNKTLYMIWSEWDIGHERVVFASKFTLHPSYKNICNYVVRKKHMTIVNSMNGEFEKIGASINSGPTVRDPTVVTFPDQETLVSWILMWS